jgi:CHAD domain-containing protein
MRPVLIPQPGGAEAVPVAPFLRGRIADLYKHLPLAMAGQEEPIHQTRVAARRLRVTVPLAARSPNGKRVGRVLRALKALSRLAARSRDLDVIVMLYEAHKPPEERAKTWDLLRRKLLTARRAARRTMMEALLDFEVPGLRRDLRAIQRKGSVEALEATLRLRLMREEVGGKVLADLAEIGNVFDPDGLHEARSAIRRMRYAAELGGWLAGGEAVDTKHFKEAQDLLGEMHDAWVLSQWLARQKILAERRGRAEEAAEAALLSVEFEDLSRVLHGKFLEWDPLVNLRRAIDQVGRSSAVA